MGSASSGAPTRPSLLLRVRDPRDTESWRLFVDVYGPLVFGHCRKRGLQHQDAEDVTQKVFAQVAQAIRAFEYHPELGRFRDWMGTVVSNEVSRFFRKQSRAPTNADVDELAHVAARAEAGAWEDDFTAHVLQEAMSRTRPHFESDTWRAFELLWLENHPAAQVAKELGRPIDWVYGAKSRILKQLWREVQELADDSPVLARIDVEA